MRPGGLPYRWAIKAVSACRLVLLLAWPASVACPGYSPTCSAPGRQDRRCRLTTFLSILMFASFIGLILTGFPVAWVLGGLSVLFTAIAIVSRSISASRSVSTGPTRR